MRAATLAGGLIAASLVATGVASATSGTPPRVTLIGDSISGSLDYAPSARRYLGSGLDLRPDTAVCRRLVAASCAFRGAEPRTALDVIRSRGDALGSVVVINVGYNDWAAVYDVDRVMRALEAARVHTVVWVTLRATTSNYARSNARIMKAAHRWRSLVVADWNLYSRGKPWFRPDGVHLTSAGAAGLSRLLRPLVTNAINGS